MLINVCMFCISIMQCKAIVTCMYSVWQRSQLALALVCHLSVKKEPQQSPGHLSQTRYSCNI